MGAAEATKASPSWLRGSGLDTSNGTEFVQQRIALFAKVVAAIALVFLLVGVTTGVAFGLPAGLYLTAPANIAHMFGLVLLTTVWLVCRRGRLPLSMLRALDMVSLVGSCTCWAFFIDFAYSESLHSAVVSVMMTALARAIIVPSKAPRTLRLSALAAAPTLVMIGVWIHHVAGGGQAGTMQYGPWLTVIYQTLLVSVIVAMATITSRILYDLRREVREANELGQYELEEKLGSGGMGEVWRARHRFLVRAAAIKLIRPELLAASHANPDLVVRRFEREARATAALSSPHTVQLFDFGQSEDGTLFYVMELLGGIDLEQLVSRFGPVPAERAVHILKQVCHSLGEAHQNGLTHRDIKPANIVVSGVGTELDFVKVLDFGLVRLGLDGAAPRPEQKKLTAEGMLTGTPAYTAPEIALGEAGYDHRVDIYAVGCVGYWLLTAQLVFDGGTVMKMIIDHAHTAPPPPHTRTELPIPPDLEKIIMECLEKDPARRPQSATELADRLSACKLPQGWTRQRADSWWRSHMPKPAPARPAAEVLLSREGTHARLLPRRAPREPGN